MSANIKIGNDTLQGVNAVELENADALGSYVKFTLGVTGGYTVTFVAEGNPYSVISVTAGSAIEEPIPPEVTGVMTGWSTDEAGTNLVSFPYTPTSDITLYAKVSAAPKTLEESTWAEIAQVSANKSWGAMGWQVGDSKTITLNGTVGTLALNNYQCKVYIIGFDHNAEKEGQGISFGMLEGIDGKQLCLDDQYFNKVALDVMAFKMNCFIMGLPLLDIFPFTISSSTETSTSLPRSLMISTTFEKYFFQISPYKVINVLPFSSFSKIIGFSFDSFTNPKENSFPVRVP